MPDGAKKVDNEYVISFAHTATDYDHYLIYIIYIWTVGKF